MQGGRAEQTIREEGRIMDEVRDGGIFTVRTKIVWYNVCTLETLNSNPSQP